jgi:thymidylate synthase (FAD)
MDPLFRVALITATPKPQQCIYAAMHQDYSENFVVDNRGSWPDERKAGQIAVKRLLSGERGHYGCYSDDTEVLTDAGWVAWPAITHANRLAAVNIEDYSIKFEHPSAVQVFDIAEADKLYEVSSRKINFAVTADHRMVVSKRRHSGQWSSWQFERAADIVGKPVRYLLAGNLVERSVPSHCPAETKKELIALFRLAGFFFGDGFRSKNKEPRSLSFRLQLQRKIDYLLGLGFEVSFKKSNRFTIYLSAVSSWIHEHFTSQTGKQIPPFVMHLPVDLFEAFADGLRNSDGTPRASSWCYDSKEKLSLDILQAAFHLNGYRASFSLNNPGTGVGQENHAPCWRLHISSREPFARAAFHQFDGTRGNSGFRDYTGKVYCATVSTGALLVRRNDRPIVLGNCLEHPQITLNVGWFPHSVMQQARTHRVGVSFDVQSMRYTGARICAAARGQLHLEEVFYLRPVGNYSDRQGKRYEYTAEDRYADLELCRIAAERYAQRLANGAAEEHARGILPFDLRQHFVVSFSLRALLHFLDLRAKADAQQEIRDLCRLMLPYLQEWVPEVADWYLTARYGKARLAP